MKFGQYFVTLLVVAVQQSILDWRVWISLRDQHQCHPHRNHQGDLGAIHILRKQPQHFHEFLKYFSTFVHTKNYKLQHDNFVKM